MGGGPKPQRSGRDERELEEQEAAFDAAAEESDLAARGDANSESAVVVKSDPRISSPTVSTIRQRKIPLKARAHVYYHRARATLRRPRWWLAMAILIGFWIVLGLPVYEKSKALGVLHTVLAIGLVFGRAWRQVSPQNMKHVTADYLTRKGRLYALVKHLVLPTTLSETERATFQRECLTLIASYVRGHRADSAGTEIFVNLLVEDGPDHLVVAARNHDHRKPGARYLKKDMLAWLAMQSGETLVTPDVGRDWTESAKDKPYRSILCIPIMGHNSVLGVVSIDSTRTYHFDLERDELERYLAPYVCLLGRSLTEPTSALRTTEGAA